MHSLKGIAPWRRRRHDRYRAPALDKGLDILELLAGIDGGLTQAEIAKRLGRSANEFYRMLDRLVQRGYVTRIDGDRYCADAQAVRPGAAARAGAPAGVLCHAADARTRRDRPGRPTSWWCSIGAAAVVIAQQEAPGYWGISIRVGSHISLFDTGSGHVLLAFRTPGRARR